MLASPHLPGFASVAGPRPALHQRRQQLDDCVWMWPRVRRLSSRLKCSNPAPPQPPPSGCSGKTCSLCPRKWQDRTFAYGTRPSVREARTRPLWRPHAPIPQACPFHQCLIENGKSAKVDLTMVARKLVGAPQPCGEQPHIPFAPPPGPAHGPHFVPRHHPTEARLIAGKY